MITYICHNKNDKTGENLPCTNNRCETSICPSCGGRSDAISEIFWCPECQVPIYEKTCPVCGQEGKKLTSDVRPVFPEERLLLEIILEKPLAFEKDSVWNGNGNNYFVNGKKIKFSVKDLKNKDADAIRKQYEELKAQNTYQYFEKQMERFILCNKERYNRIVEEAKGYIRSMTENFDITDMFVSFSGGKDSTVTAALLAKGFREVVQTAANAFRTFADKPEADYSQKEQKHFITKAVLAPMKVVKKMFVLMELHLDASIDKLDNLAMNVQIDKEKRIENTKNLKQTEPERAEAERVEAEIVNSPMVAEPQEYQYNADAFEARGADEVKQEASHKEVSKVREDKAR